MGGCRPGWCFPALGASQVNPEHPRPTGTARMWEEAGRPVAGGRWQVAGRTRRNLTNEACLGQDPHTCPQNLKGHTEAVSNSTLWGRVLETAPTMGRRDKTYPPRTGGGGGSPHLPRSRCGCTCSHVLWVTSPKVAPGHRLPHSGGCRCWPSGDGWSLGTWGPCLRPRV